jgi:hypothetical protein
MTSEQETLDLAERIAYIEGRLGMPWQLPRTGRTYDTAVDWREGGRPWSAWMRGRSDTHHASMDRNFKVLKGVMVALYAVLIAGILTLLSR